MSPRKPVILILLLVFTLLLITACGALQTTTPQTDHKYIGSINSDKYHYPACRWAEKIKPENEVWFSSAEEARKAGYKPCKMCKPPV